MTGKANSGRKLGGFSVRFWSFVLFVFLAASRTLPAQESISPQPQERPWLSLRVLPNSSEETLEFIAQVAEPTKYVEEKNRPVREILREHYGSFSKKLFQLFRKFNPWADSPHQRAKGEIVLPAGPRWEFHVEKTLAAGSTVWDEAMWEIGMAGPKTLAKIEAENPELSGRWNMLKPGEKVILPYTARVVSYPLRAEYVNRIDDVFQTLFASPDVLEVAINSPGRLVPHWTTAQLSAARPGCVKDAGEKWDVNTLLKQVPLADLKQLGKAVVAIMDSGIPANDSRFTEVLWRNRDEFYGRRDVDDDGNGYKDDVIGFDMANHRSFPLDDVEEPDRRNHGTHVAGLVSGRLLFEADAARVQERLSLMILKVALADGNISPGAIHNAFLYARRKLAKIVNLSFEGPWDPTTEKNIGLLENDMLFVVAAGNGRNFQGLNLDEETEKIYPAKYAREFDNVISVAAHDSRGRLACFSNYGAETIDLAAPGIKIESTVINGTTVLNGTSQATPLVTLGAALLVSMGVKEPAHIKRRLLASVDFVPDLMGKVKSEGKLNLAKALSIDQDVLELTDGRLIRGEVTKPSEFHIQEEDSAIPLRMVQKIIFNYSAESGKKDRVDYITPGGVIRSVVTEISDFHFPIEVELSDGSTPKYQREKLRDLVPAYELRSGILATPATASLADPQRSRISSSYIPR